MNAHSTIKAFMKVLKAPHPPAKKQNTFIQLHKDSIQRIGYAIMVA